MERMTTKMQVLARVIEQKWRSCVISGSLERGVWRCYSSWSISSSNAGLVQFELAIDGCHEIYYKCAILLRFKDETRLYHWFRSINLVKFVEAG